MVNEQPSKTTEVCEDPLPLDHLSVVEEQDQQDGVRVAEAITASWSKSSLITVYAWQVLLLKDSNFHFSNIFQKIQHVAFVFCQCTPIELDFEPFGIHHQRILGAFPAYSDQCCHQCYECGMLNAHRQSLKYLGSYRGYRYHGVNRHNGSDNDG
jgi:hypothetical protein